MQITTRTIRTLAATIYALAAGTLATHGAASVIVWSGQSAVNQDWETDGFWSDGNPASVSAAANPENIYVIPAGGRMRSPHNSPAEKFPGAELRIDGDGGYYPNNAADEPVAELRFKQDANFGTVFFPNLVMNGGELGTGNAGTVVSQGKLTIAADSTFKGNSILDRGYRIDAILTGSRQISYYQNEDNLFKSDWTNNLNIAGIANTFSGKWKVVSGPLLGSGKGSLGTNDIEIGREGALETLYDINNPHGSLILNGRMWLHQNDTFRAVSINGTRLSQGKYTFAELNAAYPASFPASWTETSGSTVSTGSGSITVLDPVPGPLIAWSGQSAVNQDWETDGFWSDGNPASVSAAANPKNIYIIPAGGRMRSPHNSPAETFPGAELRIDGDGGYYPNNAADEPVAELRFKQDANFGTVFFPNLVMNGGELGTGNGGTVVIQGKMTIAADSTIKGNSNLDRGYRIDALLTGSHLIAYYQNEENVFKSDWTNNLNIAGTANTFSGKWNVVSGPLLGSGKGSLGTNDITIGPEGALETLYDINNPHGTLILNGRMWLHQNNTFRAVSIKGTRLSLGKHTFAELNAAYPDSFPDTWTETSGSTFSTGSGSITITGDAPAPPPVSLTITKTAGGIEITYTGTLQAADSITATFTDVAGAKSPYTSATTGAARFFRARQ